jgi:hypothetical protein
MIVALLALLRLTLAGVKLSEKTVPELAEPPWFVVPKKVDPL